MHRSVSLEEFHALAKQGTGLPLSSVWRGHGSALFLEFGELHAGPEGRHPKGEVSVMLECGWRVERRTEIRFGSDSSENEIEAGIAILGGKTLYTIEPVGRLPELTLQLSGGIWVQSFMPSAGQPGWTVFLKDGSWLHVVRGSLCHERSEAESIKELPNESLQLTERPGPPSGKTAPRGPLRS